MKEIRELADSLAAQNDDIPARTLARFALAVLDALDEAAAYFDEEERQHYAVAFKRDIKRRMEARK